MIVARDYLTLRYFTVQLPVNQTHSVSKTHGYHRGGNWQLAPGQ